MGKAMAQLKAYRPSIKSEIQKALRQTVHLKTLTDFLEYYL
jgi:hypothetical protein